MLWRLFNLTSYNAENTFIIDDVLKAQPQNTFQVLEFNYDSSKVDTELVRIKMLLKKLVK